MNFNFQAKTHLLMEKITKSGYDCYLVGGAVRDYFLKRPNKDFDFATNMPLEEIKEILPVSIMKKHDHRNTAILKSKDYDYEFSTFKGTNIYEDLSNRDFKINAIAIDINGNIIDPYNGLEDIKGKRISLIKENGEAFDIDALRILRAIRFIDTLNFTIDEQTKEQMLVKRAMLKNVAPERILRELNKILLSNNILNILDEYRQIFFVLIPELQKGENFNQHNDYHIYDVYTHIMHVVDNVDSNIYLRYAALFHDIGKPYQLFIDKNNVGHFFRHQKRSNEIYEDFASKFHVDNHTRKIVSDLILHHDWQLSDNPENVYEFIKNHDHQKIEMFFKLKIANKKAQNPKYLDMEKMKHFFVVYLSTRTKYEEIKYGDFLSSLKFKNFEIGDILEDVRKKIITGQIPNEKKLVHKYVIDKYGKER